MKVQQILEDTRPYVKKDIDPALLTFDEYYDLLNPSRRTHADSAYDWSVEYYNEEDLGLYKIENFPTLLKRKKVAGMFFEFRLEKEEKMFVKYDDNDRLLYDDNGNMIRLTDEEIEALGIDKYRYTIGVFNEEGECVGATQDEWGAMLITVAKEYRGLGLGTEIGKLAWEIEPGKDSGGFSPSGRGTLRSIHARYVRDYLESGMYSYLVRTKKLSTKRVRDILASNDYNRSKRSTGNLKMNDPKDWLVMEDHGAYIVYDRKVKDMWDDGTVFDRGYWVEKTLRGMVYTMPDRDGYTRIKVFGGEDDKVKTFLMKLAIDEAQRDGNPLVVEPEDINYVPKNNTRIEGPNNIAGYQSYIVWYSGASTSTTRLIAAEKRFRRSFDRYDEFRIFILEASYGKFSL